jgi:hypothetical protein
VADCQRIQSTSSGRGGLISTPFIYTTGFWASASLSGMLGWGSCCCAANRAWQRKKVGYKTRIRK